MKEQQGPTRRATGEQQQEREERAIQCVSIALSAGYLGPLDRYGCHRAHSCVTYKAPDFWRFFAFSPSLVARWLLGTSWLLVGFACLGFVAGRGPSDDDTVGGGCGREDGVERVSL